MRSVLAALFDRIDVFVMFDAVVEISEPIFFRTPFALSLSTVLHLVSDLDFHVWLLPIVVPVELPRRALHEQGRLFVGLALVRQLLSQTEVFSEAFLRHADLVAPRAHALPRRQLLVKALVRPLLLSVVRLDGTRAYLMDDTALVGQLSDRSGDAHSLPV